MVSKRHARVTGGVTMTSLFCLGRAGRLITGRARATPRVVVAQLIEQALERELKVELGT